MSPDKTIKRQGTDDSTAPRISDAEWQVMKVLWERQPIASGDLVARLEPQHDWHPKTIRTLLGRLVKKGFVTTEAEAGRYLYRAAVDQRRVVRQEGRSFLDRVFAGDAASLLLHFARDAELSPEEADELRRLLDDSGQRVER